MGNHTCEAVVLHCMDFRFRKPLNEHFEECFPEGYDLISLAGGIKSLLADGEINNFELEQLRLSNSLHKPPVVVLVQHEDCGAYGGTENFENPEKELEFQHQQLQQAKTLIRQHLPQQTVELCFMRLSGEIVSLPG